MAVMEMNKYHFEKIEGQAWFPGTSIGIKVGYRLVPIYFEEKEIKWGVWLEPYSSISLSSYSRDGAFKSPNNPLITIGIRIVSGFTIHRP